MIPTLAALLLAASPEPPSAPVFKLTGAERVGERVHLTFEVTNPNADPMPYVGYASDFGPKVPKGEIAPLYQLQLFDGTRWAAHQLGWCGTGVGPVSIPAQGTVKFEADVPGGDWKEARVGLLWYDKADAKRPQTAWTSAVERKDIKVKK